jgi:hypothetical protein
MGVMQNLESILYRSGVDRIVLGLLAGVLRMLVCNVRVLSRGQVSK